MKVAVLSDIHGNISALEAVLKNVDESGVRTLFLPGDFVGYYYHPEKVLLRLEEYECFAVRGNHENMLEDAQNDGAMLETLSGQFGHGLAAALTKLSAKQLDWLRALPPVLETEMGGLKILLCHGSPWDTDLYIYEDSEDSVKTKCLSGGQDYVLCGHTHHPFSYEKGGKVLLNPGSVGQNRRKGGVAEWILFDPQSKKFEFRQTPYDVNSVVEEAKKMDPGLNYLREVLIR